MGRKRLSVVVLLLGVAVAALLMPNLRTVDLDELIVGDQTGVTYRGIPWGSSREEILEIAGLWRGEVRREFQTMERKRNFHVEGSPLDASETYYFEKDGPYSYGTAYFYTGEKWTGEHMEQLLLNTIEARFPVPREVFALDVPKVGPEREARMHQWKMEDGSRIGLIYERVVDYDQRERYMISLSVSGPDEDDGNE